MEDETVVTTESEMAVGSRALLSDEVLDSLMAKVEADGLELVGPNGVLASLTKAVMERALNEELTHELGYEKGDPAGRGSGNSRNGTSSKKVLTELGPVELDVPRDRNGAFEPKLVPKGARRLDGFNDQIVELYAGGMTTRGICGFVEKLYGTEVSPELVSKVTDGIIDELNEWQNRPLDAVYPILYIDALMIKVRTDGTVINRPAYVAIGVDLEGRKQVLGIWLGDGDGEGAKYWLSVLTEIRSRGTEDVIFVCCDGLKGLPDAIEATWPLAIVQTCVVHLLRGSFRFCSYQDRKAVARDLRPVYVAVNEETATAAFNQFKGKWDSQYPGIGKLWDDAWERFTPFLGYPPEIRKVIYTTNMIESINYQLRKVTKNRGHFPTDESALKLLRLTAKRITTKRGGTVGTATPGWIRALNAFAIHFGDRLKLT